MSFATSSGGGGVADVEHEGFFLKDILLSALEEYERTLLLRSNGSCSGFIQEHTPEHMQRARLANSLEHGHVMKCLAQEG